MNNIADIVKELSEKYDVTPLCVMKVYIKAEGEMYKQRIEETTKDNTRMNYFNDKLAHERAYELTDKYFKTRYKK